MLRRLRRDSRARRRFANNCLLARRLVEQGVRYVQLFDWGWDIHGTGPDDDLINGLPEQVPARSTRPVARARRRT